MLSFTRMGQCEQIGANLEKNARAGAPGRGNSMAEIVFCPVCSNCGAVQWEQKVDFEQILLKAADNDKILYPDSYQISPERCINCGERFVQIKMPIKLPWQCDRKPQRRTQALCREVERCPRKEPRSCCWKCQYVRTCVDACHYDPDTCTKAQRSL